jgi:hypothetical protein
MKKDTTKYTVLSVDYQRNGSGGGIGFYDVRFIFEEEGERPHFLALIVPSDCIPEDAVPWHKFGPIDWKQMDYDRSCVISIMDSKYHWRGPEVAYPIIRFIARHDGCAHYLYSEDRSKKQFFPHVINEDAETHYEITLDGKGGSTEKVWYGIDRPEEKEA